MISIRAQECKESATLAISAKAKELRAQGYDVIDFGAGQPDFDVPENIRNVAKQAIDEKGSGKYTPVAGIPELKKAVANKLKRDNSLIYAPDEIIINCGAKHTLYNIFQAILDTGDEVIIPSPYWVSYPDMVRLASGKPVFVNTDDKFKLFASDLEDAITERTKAIVINSPSNPTGMAIEPSELEKIAQIAISRKILVISDEIYEKMMYDSGHVSIASYFDERSKNLCIIVNGLSKAYAMPGWRIGYAAGPKEIIGAMSRIQAQSTSNPASIMQKGAVEALTGDQEQVRLMVDEFRRRRHYIVNELNKIPQIECIRPDGAFYVFPKIPSDDDFGFAKDLLEKEHVAVVPGSEFGKRGHVRISYACSMDEIKKGVERIRRFVSEYR